MYSFKLAALSLMLTTSGIEFYATKGNRIKMRYHLKIKPAPHRNFCGGVTEKPDE